MCRLLHINSYGQAYRPGTIPGQQPQHVIVSAPCSARVSTTTKDNGNTRYFDTEMLSLNAVGLPGGMMIRESPTRQSAGKRFRCCKYRISFGRRSCSADSRI